MIDDRSNEPVAARTPRAARPKVRITVRGLLLLVALSALTMLVYREVKDGLPPRFVIRSVPGRIARLRPGMTRAKARAILGVDRPWYLGGSGPPAATIDGAGIRMRETRHEAPEGAPIFRLSDDSHERNSVVLVFVKRPGDPDAGGPGPLVQASFCDGVGIVTRMLERR